MAKSATELAKDLGLESNYEYDEGVVCTANDYFDYIVNSVSNGQKQQAYECFVAMDMPSRAAFWDYLREACSPNLVADTTKAITSRM